MFTMNCHERIKLVGGGGGGVKIVLDKGAGASEGDDSSCDCVVYLLSGIGNPHCYSQT